MNEPIVVDVVEAASMLRISRTKIYELIRDREIGSVLIGKSRRVLVADLHGLVERLSGKAAAAG